MIIAYSPFCCCREISRARLPFFRKKARIKEITAASGKTFAGLRVGVKNGGCAGMSYTMEYAESINPNDEVVDDKGVRILIDPKAVLFLLGENAPTRTIMGAGAGSFAVVRIMESEGVNLPRDQWTPDAVAGIRFDAGYRTGSDVPPNSDAMLAKVINDLLRFVSARDVIDTYLGAGVTQRQRDRFADA